MASEFSAPDAALMQTLKNCVSDPVLTRSKRSHLERQLNNPPEWRNPPPVLPTDLGERLDLIRQIDQRWEGEFPWLAGAAFTQPKPGFAHFNDVQVASLAMAGTDRLRLFLSEMTDGTAIFRSQMAALQNIPCLIKKFATRSRSDAERQAVELAEGLASVPPPGSAENERKALDGELCILSKTFHPEICHIIPPPADEASRALLDRLLDEVPPMLAFDGHEYTTDELRQAFSSAVGWSHAAWNMVSMSKTLHDWWGRAIFALRFDGFKAPRPPVESHPDDIVELVLMLHYMPRRVRDTAGKLRDTLLNSLDTAFAGDFGDLCQGTRQDGWPLESGDIFYVRVKNRDADNMIMAFRVQYALLCIQAMAGGADIVDELPDVPLYLDRDGRWPGMVVSLCEALARAAEAQEFLESRRERLSL